MKRAIILNTNLFIGALLSSFLSYSGEFFNRKKTTCMLYLQADHLFYEEMGRSEEACIEVMTRHVQSVNNISRKNLAKI